LGVGRFVQAAQHSGQARGMIGTNTGQTTLLEKGFKPLMPECLNHDLL
jgi:hypothetical protein